MTPQTRAKLIFIFRLYSSVVVVAAQWAGSFYVIFFVIRTWSQTAGKRLCTHLTWSHNTLTQAGEGEVGGEGGGGSQKNTAGSLDNRGRRVHNSEMLEEIFHKFSFFSLFMNSEQLQVDGDHLPVSSLPGEVSSSGAFTRTSSTNFRKIRTKRTFIARTQHAAQPPGVST